MKNIDEKIVFEETLPIDIQERIIDFKKAYIRMKTNTGRNDIDIFADELLGSINSALHGFEIDENTAKYLRDKYIFEFEEGEVFKNGLNI